MTAVKRKSDGRNSSNGKKFKAMNNKNSSKRNRASKGSFANKVRRAIAPEVKEFITSSAGGQAAVGGTTIALNSIPQGTDIGNRIGRHVKITGVDFTWNFQSPTGSTASQQDDAFLVSLVWDAEADNALAGFNVVYDTASGTAIPFLAEKNTAQYRDRFKILWEERMFASAATAGIVNSGNNENQFGRKYVSLANGDFDTEFVGSATGVPGKGGLILCLGSFQNTGAAATSGTIYWNCKVTYTDL